MYNVYISTLLCIIKCVYTYTVAYYNTKIVTINDSVSAILLITLYKSLTFNGDYRNSYITT